MKEAALGTGKWQQQPEADALYGSWTRLGLKGRALTLAHLVALVGSLAYFTIVTLVFTDYAALLSLSSSLSLSLSLSLSFFLSFFFLFLCAAAAFVFYF